MTSFILAAILSQFPPLHPSPATANGVPVGNGQNWVTKTIPGCFGASQAIQFDGGFQCATVTLPTPSVWTAMCPSGITCNDATSNSYFSWYKPKVGTNKATTLTCQAVTSGSLTGNLTMHVSDGTTESTCDIPCNTGTTRVAEVCTLSPALTLSSASTYRVYSTGCVVQPSVMWCNIPLESP